MEYIQDCNCGSCKEQPVPNLPTEEDQEGDEFDSGLITDTFNVTINGLQLKSNRSSNSSNQLGLERWLFDMHLKSTSANNHRITLN